MKKIFFALLFLIALLNFISVRSVQAAWPYCSCGDSSCDVMCGENVFTCPADCSSPTYNVSGNVWNDYGSGIPANDYNGVKNGGEANHSNVTVTVAGYAPVVTDASGNYTVSGVANGTYNVTMTLPANYVNSNTGVNPNPHNITVSGSNVSNINFGLKFVPTTYSISGNVWDDFGSGNLSNDLNGVKNVGESGHSGVTVTVAGYAPVVTDGSGNYTVSGITAGTYNVTMSLPTDYLDSNTGVNPNPHSVTIVASNVNNINFGLKNSPPTCGTVNMPGGNVDPGGNMSLSVSNCSITPTPTIVWDPPGGNGTPQCSDGIDNNGNGLIDAADPNCHTDGNASNPGSYNSKDGSETSGSNTCQDGGVSSPTSISTTWYAPTCPVSNLVCTPSVTLSNAGGSTTYTSGNINVARTYSVTGYVRVVPDANQCNSTYGSAYTTAPLPSVLLSSASYNPPSQTIDGSGTTSFACIPQGTNYTLALNTPSGYQVVNRNVDVGSFSNSGSNGVTFDLNSSDLKVTFCIEPTTPWYKTTFGDTRFVSLSNAVPTGKYASDEPTYPGIFYSSKDNSDFGLGGASVNGWKVNKEYDYNSKTKNRNGTFGYSFLKSRARQEGITPTTLNSGALDSQITGSGVYEYQGDLTINSYTHPSNSRVTILVGPDSNGNGGNVNIDTSISIPSGQGFLIIAAKKDITIASNVGTASLNSATSNLDGFYAAEGNIIIDGGKCLDGNTKDLRLNVGGSLIANALKPFDTNSTTGGKIELNRSLCTDNLNYPALYVVPRPDFLTRLTDFYKVSYTKWTEQRP